MSILGYNLSRQMPFSIALQYHKPTLVEIFQASQTCLLLSCNSHASNASHLNPVPTTRKPSAGKRMTLPMLNHGKAQRAESAYGGCRSARPRDMHVAGVAVPHCTCAAPSTLHGY